VPDLVGCLLQRAHNVRVAIAERVDGDAAVEVEVLRAILREQSDALAPLESEFGSGVRPVERGHGRRLLLDARFMRVAGV